MNMMKVTMMKDKHGTDTLRVLALDAVAETIRKGEYEKEVKEARTMYPYIDAKREDDGSFSRGIYVLQPLPRLCFASLMENRRGSRVMKGYTGLVLLEVNNLTGIDEARAIRGAASMMPQTLLCFVGASGRSVKIVCRGELYRDGKAKGKGGQKAENSGRLPEAEADILRFHENVYEKARLAYNAQLGVSIEKLEPLLHRVCYVSADKDAFYHADALPFYTDCSVVEQAVNVWHQADREDATIENYLSAGRIYQFNLAKVYDELEHIDDDEEAFQPMVIQRLADYCVKTGIPMGVALRLTLSSLSLGKDKDLVRLTFANAYRRGDEKKYRARKGISRPTDTMPPETLLTMKIDIFLRTNYELRLNVMRGVAEYRVRQGLGFTFQDLTLEARNSMTMRALEQGIKCWDRDIQRYVNSDDIDLYDPMEDFLDHLPRWDGKDRVEPLARRVGCDYAEWPWLFHVWMRSMVAMWQGKGQLTGNALVPLLIGRQGCGKSSFCRILLPNEQREYYNDRINFKNDNDLNIGLSSFALINLDEFDKITQRQQIVLKYLVSTSDLKYRAPYGTAYRKHRRYASFIGTTNEPMPLTDPSGSRRFVCVQVEGDIDFQTPIEYGQLYAQLKQEIESGERYWLTADEEAALMEHNLNFQRMSGLGEMFNALFSNPADGAEGQWLSLGEIVAKMKMVYGSGFREEPGTFEKLGRLMSQPNNKFRRSRHSSGTKYFVAERRE